MVNIYFDVGSKLIKNLWGKASKDHMGKRKDAILFADDLLSQSGGSC
jgi:phosphoenolpyruvate-protein kinase (PTS system EI component)